MGVTEPQASFSACFGAPFLVQIKQLISRGVDGLLIHTRSDTGESERIVDIVKGRVPVVTFSYLTKRIWLP